MYKPIIKYRFLLPKFVCFLQEILGSVRAQVSQGIRSIRQTMERGC